MLAPLGSLLILLLDIYVWIIIIAVALSWLVAFNVVNTKNAQAANLVKLFERLTEPVYRPLRKYIPPIGGIDITPIIVILGINIVKMMVASVFF